MILPRRSFLTGIATLLAAPAIVRADSLMKISPPPLVLDGKRLVILADGRIKDVETGERFSMSRVQRISNCSILNTTKGPGVLAIRGRVTILNTLEVGPDLGDWHQIQAAYTRNHIQAAYTRNFWMSEPS